MPIVITSKIAGFRRAGVAHPAEPAEHPDGRFTAAQLDQLRAEPMLVVVETPDEPAQDPEAPGGKKKGQAKPKPPESAQEEPPQDPEAPGEQPPAGQGEGQ